MDVARLNTSHGDMAGHVATVAMVREAAKEEGRPIGVLLDLGGPKLRTGALASGGPVTLTRGQRLAITPEAVGSDATRVHINYARLVDDVQPGDPILLDDGNIELVAVETRGGDLVAEVIFGGILGANRGVSLPQSWLQLPSLTDRDRLAIAAGVKAEVDFFALSFVREAGDVAEARATINGCGGDIPIIAKIERRLAIEHLDEIMAETDGAMVARGDLGVELPPEDVPVQQRRIIASAALHKVPVITATQMLESMVQAPRPTRAEASDVANAVWDMSDALMLSGETAIGRYPVETVAMMDRIIRKAESELKDTTPPAPRANTDDHSYVVALAARRIVESDQNMRAVVCYTSSGYTAVLMSKVHPQAPIYALSHNAAVVNRLSLARGVIPMLCRPVDTADEVFSLVDERLVESGAVAEGEEVLIVAGLPVAAAGTTNFIKLHQVGESR
jgi:pyruvate kinase